MPHNLACTENPVILLVDDDPSLLDLLAQILSEERPYQVVKARSGEQALQIAQQVPPSLLVTDYMLPGLDGLALYDAFHALPGRERIPALMLSAALPRQAVCLREIVGIAKPFDLDDFLERIDGLLESRPVEALAIQ